MELEELRDEPTKLNPTYFALREQSLAVAVAVAVTVGVGISVNLVADAAERS